MFDLIARRLLAVLSDDALFDATALVTEVDVMVQLAEGDVSPQRFRARGRVCRQAGWRAVDPPGKQKERTFPAVEVDDLATVTGSEVAEGVTRPPRPHNDASILRAMELAGKDLDDRDLARVMRSAGLGTPATRAAVLQTLLDRQYAFRDKKALRATPKGKTLIAAVPVNELKSAELTGLWEGRLSEMAEGRHTRDDFLRDVSEHVHRIVDAIRETPPPPVAGEERDQGPELGACPACEKPVRARGPVWSCDTGRSCSFVVFQTMSKRRISERMVKQLLKDGRSSAVKGFKSKKGNSFEAGLLWDTEAKRVGFWFPERKPEVKSGPEGQPCPRCRQGRIIRGRTAFGCNRWREGCEHRIPL